MSVFYKPQQAKNVSAYIITQDTKRLINFIVAIFDGQSSECTQDEAGVVDHAEITIGDSVVMVGGSKTASVSNAVMYTYVKDVDAVYNKALDLGAESVVEPTDQYYGDRNAAIKDFTGTTWWIATHIEDVSKEELEKRSKAQHT